MTLALVRWLAVGPTSPDVASTAELRTRAAAAPVDTIARAATGGLGATSLAWAFACGYESALERLVPGVTRGGALVAALCATEEGGGHPRAIRASLAPRDAGGWTLTGRKTWVTLGADADALLVVASTGSSDGRNQLRLAQVPTHRAGLRLEQAPPLPFAPELGHVRAIFEDVAVEATELLPGDGYDAYLKPFRTIEDAHVLAAAIGWSVRVARASGWDRAWIDQAIALVVLVHAIAQLAPTAPETHVALAGAFATARHRLDHAPWTTAAAPTQAAWKRDRPLLDVASTVRAARHEAAWRALTEGSP